MKDRVSEREGKREERKRRRISCAVFDQKHGVAAESCLLWLVFVCVYVCVRGSVSVVGHGVTQAPLFFRHYYTSAQQHAQTPSGALSWAEEKQSGRLSASNLKQAASPLKTRCQKEVPKSR